MLIIGLAGTGKSFTVKKLVESIGKEKCALLATTNRAARLISDKNNSFITCHTFLGIFEGQTDFSKRNLIKLANKYDYIIIDEIGLMNRELYNMFYFMKINSNVKFILSGDSAQLKPIQSKGMKLKSVSFFNSTVMKQLVDYNITQLLVNHRSCEKMWELYKRMDELEPCDFGNQFTKVHLCWDNITRIRINNSMMDIETKRLKKQPLKISKQEDNKNSQDVKLLPTFPVMAFKTNKKLGVYNGDTFVVKKIKPSLVLKNTLNNEIITITTDIFRCHFYINFCSTIYKSQGSKINVPYTIHQWNSLSNEAKYTAISRTTSYEYVNVSVDEANEDLHDLPDTNTTLLQRRIAEKNRMNNKLYKRRKESHSILMRIVHNPNTSDIYSIRHTLKTRTELLEYLKITGGIPKNYNIDHIKERKTCVNEEDFKTINYYTNLRLLPFKDNIARNFK